MITVSILAEHIRRNWTTRGRWDAMTVHRTRVMELLRRARGESGKTLCVLGPGNGNDIELGTLAREFEKVALVDLDEGAVRRAVSRLSAEEAQRVEPHCPVELSGVLPVLESWRARGRRTDEEITAVKRAVMAAPRPAVGEFDVVASTCILTQLIDAVYMSLPTKHSRRDELLMAVRDRHLEMILEMVNPGGVGVLVTDFVVAVATQELAPLAELALSSSMQSGMKRSEFFTGTDPFEIRDFYKGLCGPGPTAADVAIEGPWRWEVGGRLLGVCAVRFRRRG
jgi:hypothetical protein